MPSRHCTRGDPGNLADRRSKQAYIHCLMNYRPDTRTWCRWLTLATSMRPTSTAASVRDSKNCQPRVISPNTAVMCAVFTKKTHCHHRACVTHCCEGQQSHSQIFRVMHECSLCGSSLVVEARWQGPSSSAVGSRSEVDATE